MEKIHKYFKHLPITLLFLYIVYFFALSINPHNRLYWMAANVVPVLLVLTFTVSYKRFRFSNFSYILAALLVFMQTLGAHYFFYRVPFDWITETFHFSRNNFDRVVHVSVGFYAFLIAEYIDRKKTVNTKKFIILFPFFCILGVAALYEILEFGYVMAISPNSDADFLGAQGDIWDAEKDMLCDGIGAIMVLIVYYLSRIKNKRQC